MNELSIFKSEQFGEVRTLTINKEPWFVLKDICGALDLSSPHKVADRLDKDERSQIPLIDSIGRQQETTVINEAGLYSVIIRSDKPEAKYFKRWLTHEVIPQIRKHGVYATEEVLNNPDLWIKALQELKAERERSAKLSEAILKDRPKVIFANAVSVSEGTILIGELAKILKGNGIEVGQNRLFEKLRQEGYLIKRKGSDYNMPTQKSMELGLLKVKETAITHSDGHVTISKTTKVTGKGQQYFTNLFLGDCND